MKKTAFILMISTMALVSSCKEESKTQDHFDNQKEIVDKSIVIDEHTSRSSLDWEGTYTGTLPDGVYTEVTLNSDNTFILHTTKTKTDIKDKSSRKGTYQWDESGSNISMEIDGTTIRYKVGENQLILLDKDGNVQPNLESENYRLIKQMDKNIN